MFSRIRKIPRFGFSVLLPKRLTYALMSHSSPLSPQSQLQRLLNMHNKLPCLSRFFWWKSLNLPTVLNAFYQSSLHKKFLPILHRFRLVWQLQTSMDSANEQSQIPLKDTEKLYIWLSPSVLIIAESQNMEGTSGFRTWDLFNPSAQRRFS